MKFEDEICIDRCRDKRPLSAKKGLHKAKVKRRTTYVLFRINLCTRHHGTTLEVVHNFQPKLYFQPQIYFLNTNTALDN